MRFYIGGDWADAEHAVWVEDENTTKIASRIVPQTAEGLSEWGRWLDERRAEGIELWAALENPEGRIVDFLLDHGVLVFPVNPKALDRARDRFRMSGRRAIPSMPTSWRRSCGRIMAIWRPCGPAPRRLKSSRGSRATMPARSASKRGC